MPREGRKILAHHPAASFDRNGEMRLGNLTLYDYFSIF
jgi:hypothetical protein